jgi:hypothetical protein
MNGLHVAPGWRSNDEVPSLATADAVGHSLRHPSRLEHAITERGRQNHGARRAAASA